MQEKGLNDLEAAELYGRFAENCDIRNAIESGKLTTLDAVLHALEGRNDQISNQMFDAGIFTPGQRKPAARVSLGRSRYPRVERACLDAGMLLMIGGVLGGAASALEIIDGGYLDFAVAILLAGLAIYAVSERLAKTRTEVKPPYPRLRRVK